MFFLQIYNLITIYDSGLLLLPILATAQSPGTLVTSFGNSGKAIIDILGNDNLANAVTVKPNGKIVVAGMMGSNFVIYQLNDDGTIDKSFNKTGIVSVDFGATSADVACVCFQGDGKIIIAGSVVDNGVSDFGVLRVNADGSIDSTFGTNGKTEVDNNARDDRGYAMKIQADGKIVVSGYSVASGDADFMTIRLKTDGSLDNTFGNSGISQIDIGSQQDKCYGNYIQSDGKILVGGTTDNSGLDFIISRLNSDGTLDNNFGKSGKTITDFKGNDDWGFSIAMQSTGNILLTGYCKSSNNNDYATARYDSSGKLDTKFGFGGLQVTPIGQSDDFGRGIWIQQNDYILIIGRYKDANGKLAVGLLRYDVDGTLDKNFGTNGIFTRKFGSSGDDYTNSIAMNSSDKILVAGFTTANGTYDMGVMEVYAGATTAISNTTNSNQNYNLYVLSKYTLKLELNSSDINSHKVQISIYSFDGKLIPSTYNYNDNGYIIEVPEYYSNHLLLVQVNDNKCTQTYKVKL